MRFRIFAVFMAAATLLLAAGTAAAQPLPPPMSPEEARFVEQYPALRDARAAGGGIVIAGVKQFGCGNLEMDLNLAIFIPDPDQRYTIRTKILINGAPYMNERVLLSELITTGLYTWVISDDDSGGPAGANFPLPDETPFAVQMLFAEENGKPLWYAEMTIADCEGTPDTTSNNRSVPVRVVSKNPTFQPDSADPTRAAKWTPGGKVKYSCDGSVCTEKMVGKAGLVATLTQNAKLKTPLEPGWRTGVTMIVDLADTAGAATFRVTPMLNGGGLGFLNLNLVADTPLQTVVEVGHLPFSSSTLSEADKFKLEFTFQDSLTPVPASGKIKIKAVYVYVIYTD